MGINVCKHGKTCECHECLVESTVDVLNIIAEKLNRLTVEVYENSGAFININAVYEKIEKVGKLIVK